MNSISRLRVLAAAGSVVLVSCGPGTSSDAPATSSIAEPPSTAPAEIAPSEMVDGGIVLPPGFYPQHLSSDGEMLYVLATPEPYGRDGTPQESVSVVALRRDGTVVWQTDLGDAPALVAAGGRAVWVAHYYTGGVTRLDPATGEVEATVVPELPFDFGSGPDRRRFTPGDLEVGSGSVWMSTARGAVARINTETVTVEAVIELTPPAPGDLSIGQGGVWVAENAHGFSRIDPATNQVTTLSLDELDHAAQFVAVDDNQGVVWVAGDRLARTEDGGFRQDHGGSYLFADEYTASAIDPDTFTVLGSVRFDQPLRWLGYLDAFFGALDRDGVFHHLSSTIQEVTDATIVSDDGEGVILGLGWEAWLVDQGNRRVVQLREVRPITIDLPIRIGDPTERRPISGDLAVSPDWLPLDSGPLSPRWPAVAAWTGTEIVIWGGETIGGGDAFGDGAAYDPASGNWRLMPPSPIGAENEPGWVWTGSELVVWAGSHAAAWDPGTNMWRDLGGTELRGSFYRRAVWTGEEIIDTLSGIAYNPATGTSREISAPPQAGERSQVVWTGQEVVFITGEGRYNPTTDTWQPMAGSVLTPLSVDGAWVGDRLVAVDYGTNAAAYDPRTDTWTVLPDVPVPDGECFVAVHEVAGMAVLDYCGTGAVYDDPTQSWVPFAPPDAWATDPPLIPAGDDLYAFGQNGFYRFGPDLRRAWSEVKRLVVGLPVDVPAGWQAEPDTQPGTSISLVSPDGSRCSLEAMEGSAEVIISRHLNDGATVAELTPRIGGLPYQTVELTVGTIDDHHHLRWAPLGTLVLDVACTTREGAEALLQHIIWAWQ